MSDIQNGYFKEMGFKFQYLIILIYNCFSSLTFHCQLIVSTRITLTTTSEGECVCVRPPYLF